MAPQSGWITLLRSLALLLFVLYWILIAALAFDVGDELRHWDFSSSHAWLFGLLAAVVSRLLAKMLWRTANKHQGIRDDRFLGSGS